MFNTLLYIYLVNYTWDASKQSVIAIYGQWTLVIVKNIYNHLSSVPGLFSKELKSLLTMKEKLSVTVDNDRETSEGDYWCRDRRQFDDLLSLCSHPAGLLTMHVHPAHLCL